MKGVAAMLSVGTAFLIVLAFVFGDLPTIALSTDISSVNAKVDRADALLETKIVANESFMLDEAIDRLQGRIYTNIDRQQTYLDKQIKVPGNLREQLNGFEEDMEKLKKRRNKLP